MKKDEVIEELIQEFKRIRQSPSRTRFSPSLKKRVLFLHENGYSMSFLCEKLNLYRSQLFSWKSELNQKKILDKKDYEIKHIPVIPTVQANSKTVRDKGEKKKQFPRFFFRIFSLKIIFD